MDTRRWPAVGTPDDARRGACATGPMHPLDVATGAPTPGTPTPATPTPGTPVPDRSSPAPTRPGAGPRSGPGTGARTLSHAGVTWTVPECEGARVPGNADGARGRRCLLFASPEVIRRVWDAPADWRALPAAALFALSWRR